MPESFTTPVVSSLSIEERMAQLLIYEMGLRTGFQTGQWGHAPSDTVTKLSLMASVALTIKDESIRGPLVAAFKTALGTAVSRI